MRDSVQLQHAAAARVAAARKAIVSEMANSIAIASEDVEQQLPPLADMPLTEASKRNLLG